MVNTLNVLLNEPKSYHSQPGTVWQTVVFSSCLLLGALPLEVFFCHLIDSSEPLMGEEEAYRAPVLLLPGRDEVSILVSGSWRFTSAYLFLRNSLVSAMVVEAYSPTFILFPFFCLVLHCNSQQWEMAQWCGFTGNHGQCHAQPLFNWMCKHRCQCCTMWTYSIFFT